MTYKVDCKLFSGYKPCKHKRSCDGCEHYSPAKQRVAVLSLEAMGAVLRSTCLLPAIKRRYPDCHITWVTLPNVKALLANNPMIDRLITLEASTLSLVNFLEFDLLYAVDKSLEAGSLAETMRAKEKFGFGLSPLGAIRPLNKEAEYQYAVGLDDDLKFYKNQKPETQQLTESMALEWVRDPYILELTDTEKEIVSSRRSEMIASGAKNIIGYNTGCSLLFPNKKLTVPRSIELVREWRQNFPDSVVALLGGREDAERQAEIKKSFKDDKMVVNTPTSQGLRSGVMWMDTCDMVFSGCSLGAHIAIALKKKIVAWYGVSCLQEVDVYDIGVQLQSPVKCSPCWKKTCSENPMCYDALEVSEIIEATRELDL